MSGEKAQKIMTVSTTSSRTWLLRFPLLMNRDSSTAYVADVEVGLHASGEGNMRGTAMVTELLQVLFDHDMTDPQVLGLILKAMGHKQISRCPSDPLSFESAASTGRDHER